MNRFLAPLLAIFLAACGTTADPASDAPERQRIRVGAFKDATSYSQALQVWRTAEDLNAWIGARFRYDMSRAMLLSESQRGRSGPLPIYPPHDFFTAPSGVCVDLSRFAVETLRQIDREAKANYLMIEFSPVTISGNTLRLHWLASFTRDGKYYFFADSKRPGHIAGPYANAAQFIAEYSVYRNRTIVAFRELDSYQRKRRTLAPKQSREERRL
ncbi:MAG: hypothetical protein PHS32_16835 [Rhodoferax sp.]|uniref:hypothetical protein n=1 Tax=Rhodoferax sp. TaxID=50421 RepID=UPI002612B066|nr:hypothetical protein [Rhodoferax sp.]MDD5335400.1 hypothetical protein [Rhodoferax sp.]